MLPEYAGYSVASTNRALSQIEMRKSGEYSQIDIWRIENGLWDEMIDGLYWDSFWDSHGGKPQSGTQGEGDQTWGKIYIISNVRGDMNSMAGHAWIRLEGSNGKTITTMSLWGNRGKQEFWTNLEINYGYGEVSKSRIITELQYNKVAEFNSIASHLNWTPWNTCAGYSARLWNYVTGDNLSSRDWFFFTTPRSLSNSILKNP
jgi:hypothetical protein